MNLEHSLGPVDLDPLLDLLDGPDPVPVVGEGGEVLQEDEAVVDIGEGDEERVGGVGEGVKDLEHEQVRVGHLIERGEVKF